VVGIQENQSPPISFPAAAARCCGAGLVNEPAIILADDRPVIWTAQPRKKSCVSCRISTERGIALVMVTHEHDIAAYATRILHMKDGHLLSDEINPSIVSPSRHKRVWGLMWID
jgi:ABC-type phosphate/phosphonate transport system ATPase subunit